MESLVDFILLNLYFLRFLDNSEYCLKYSSRRWWVKPFNRENERQAFGALEKIFLYYKHNDSEAFYKFTRMTPPQFQYLYTRVRPHITKRSYRQPLPPQLRLAVTIQ